MLHNTQSNMLSLLISSLLSVFVPCQCMCYCPRYVENILLVTSRCPYQGLTTGAAYQLCLSPKSFYVFFSSILPILQQSNEIIVVYLYQTLCFALTVLSSFHWSYLQINGFQEVGQTIENVLLMFNIRNKYVFIKYCIKYIVILSCVVS